jgi:hypothetical protein
MPQYWFRPKSYGYGATPITWEGWVVTLAVAAVFGGSIVVMNLLVGPSNVVAWLVWAAVIASLILWFVQFCRRRTDGEWGWRWGRSSDAPGI